MGAQRLAVFGDSELVIKQTMGTYDTKELHLIPYHRYVIKLANKFKDITFLHIPRNQNDFADALDTLASLVRISAWKGASAIGFTIHHAPSYENSIGEISNEMPLPEPPGSKTSMNIYKRDHFQQGQAKLKGSRSREWQ